MGIEQETGGDDDDDDDDDNNDTDNEDDVLFPSTQSNPTMIERSIVIQGMEH